MNQTFRARMHSGATHFPVASLVDSVLSMATMVIGEIAAKLRAKIDAQVPEGYEDESGFHFGAPLFKN
jgi:hypothetical protein